MIYVDTSVVVALLTVEPSTQSIVNWFSKINEPLISSDWLLTEFSSAISIKLRTRQISDTDAKLVQKEFNSLVSGGLKLIPVSRAAFQSAATMTSNYQSRLRSGDSLHLAIAKERGIQTIATLDKVMTKNAQTLGLKTELFSHPD